MCKNNLNLFLGNVLSPQQPARDTTPTTGKRWFPMSCFKKVLCPPVEATVHQRRAEKKIPFFLYRVQGPSLKKCTISTEGLSYFIQDRGQGCPAGRWAFFLWRISCHTCFAVPRALPGVFSRKSTWINYSWLVVLLLWTGIWYWICAVWSASIGLGSSLSDLPTLCPELALLFSFPILAHHFTGRPCMADHVIFFIRLHLNFDIYFN